MAFIELTNVDTGEKTEHGNEPRVISVGELEEVEEESDERSYKD